MPSAIGYFSRVVLPRPVSQKQRDSRIKSQECREVDAFGSNQETRSVQSGSITDKAIFLITMKSCVPSESSAASVLLERFIVRLICGTVRFLELILQAASWLDPYELFVAKNLALNLC